jgi:protein SPA2
VLDDQIPTAQDGGILDIHVTAFVSAIDTLLTTGRSNAPTKVLTPMKSVVNSVSAILDDVQAFERRPSRDRSDVDVEALRSLRERADATLSNLAAAAKTHATSAGMSPVSLLDAAASHISATITELGKTICIRKATKVEQEQYTRLTSGSTSSTIFSPPASRPLADPPARKASSASSRRADITPLSPPSRIPKIPTLPFHTSNTSVASSRRRPSVDQSSSGSSSPPPIFDKPHATGSDDSAQADTPEDAWAELKVSGYLVDDWRSLTKHSSSALS